MALTLIHTAQIHVATFDRLRDQIAPDAALCHIVEPDWLDEARRNGLTPDLSARLNGAIRDATGPVICTCTTLGDLAETHGAMRIDRPMMRAAAATDGVAVMAYALDSTKSPSRDLFVQEAGEHPLRMLDLTAHWPLFESGDVAAFQTAVAGDIRADVVKNGGDVVILAQASMAGAATLLTDLGIPVLASPEMALRAGLGLLSIK